MKKTMGAIMAIALSSILVVSCGGKDADTQKAGKEKETVKKQEMTIERAAELDNKLAALLMEEYWDKFKGKNYKDVKDIYEKYEEEQKAIYAEYGITQKDRQNHTYWKLENRSELKEFRQNNPEYDFYSNYPEYMEALRKVSDLSSAALSEALKSR